MAFPPSPLVAVFSGLLIASPELPEVPPTTFAELSEAPEEAEAHAVGFAVALPESPVLPDSPDVTSLSVVAAPLPPVAMVPPLVAPVFPDTDVGLEVAEPVPPEPPV